MGERLVVRVLKNDKPIASVYYHWSAYSLPAATILRSMHKHVLANADKMSTKELQLSLIRFAEKTTPYGHPDDDDRSDVQKILETISDGDPLMKEIFDGHGGLSIDDLEIAKRKFPRETFVEEGISRNEGLVSITQSSIDKDVDWAQMLIDVDLNNRQILNGPVYEYNLEDYLYESEDDIDPKPHDEVQLTPVDLSKFTFDDIEIVYDVIQNTTETWLRYGDKYFRLING